MPPRPLKPNHFHILGVLAGGPAHGFAIQRAVREETAGAVRLWPATLYGALEELVAQGWIAEVTDPRDRPAESGKRRYYRITRSGRHALAAEVGRLEELAAQFKTRLGVRS